MIPVWSAFTTNSGGDVVGVDGMSELKEPQPDHHLPAFRKLLSLVGCHPDPHVQPPNEAPDPCSAAHVDATILQQQSPPCRRVNVGLDDEVQGCGGDCHRRAVHLLKNELLNLLHKQCREGPRVLPG